jgi:hypothetical protein
MEVNKMENVQIGVNSPIQKFSAGAVTATVWENNGTSKEGQPVNYKTISFDRRYKDRAGEWKSTSSLRVTDIPKAVVVLNKAFEFSVLRGQEAVY